MFKITKKILLFILTITCGLHAEGLYEAISKENLKSFAGAESEKNGDSIGSLIKGDKHFYQVVGDKLKDQLNPKTQTSRDHGLNWHE